VVEHLYVQNLGFDPQYCKKKKKSQVLVTLAILTILTGFIYNSRIGQISFMRQ
jgi:hypothetical protein